MIKTYKYRVYPTGVQREFLEKSFGCTRYVYNWALNLRNDYYKQNNALLTFTSISKQLTALRSDEDRKWLKEVVRECLQQSIKDLDIAYLRFFMKKSDFPRYKSKRKGGGSCRFRMNMRFDFDNKKIKVPKAGWVKYAGNRTFIGKLKTLTINRGSSGRYYASAVVDDGLSSPIKYPVTPENTIGIDVGIKNFATLSNGTIYKNMKFLENNEKRLVVLQRRLSRKQKGSKRRFEAKIRLAKQHEKIRNSRTNYLHQVSSMIIAENQSIVIEDLNIAGLLKNHRVAKGIGSVAWASFFKMLKYKAEWNGNNLIKIGRFDPSSKLCTCGAINDGLRLSDRTWACTQCGTVHDRDLLAANNIKRFGLQKMGFKGYSPAVGGSEDVELSALVGATKRQCIRATAVV